MTEQFSSSRCIALASQKSSPEFEDESDPIEVNGVALGEGDTTRGASGIATYWPGDVLREAASMLEGKPIVVNNNPESHAPGSQPPVSDIVGEVTDTAYAEGVGIIYQGEVDDYDIAQKIARGRVDVSPVMARTLGDYDEQRDARVAESISEFRDLGIVFQGASASNSIEIGPNPSAAALAGEALAAAWAAEDPAGEVEALQQFKHLEYPAGTMTGELDEAAIPTDAFRSHYLVPGETKSESAYPVVDAEGHLRRGNVKSAWNLRGNGDVSKGDMERILLRLNEQFDTPPIDPENAEAMADDGIEQLDESAESDTDADADQSPPEGDDPTTDDADGASTSAGGVTTDNSTMDLTEDEEALVHAARSLDNPSVVEAEVEAFADKREQFDNPTVADESTVAWGTEAAGYDNPVIVEEDEHDALSQQAENVEALRGFLAGQLAEQTGLSEDTASALSLEALMGEFSTDDGDIDGEALLQTQTPEAGTAGEEGTEALANNGGGGDIEALSASERKEAKQKLDKADLMESRTPDYAESLRAEVADMVGAESAEDIDMEAL